MTGWLLASALFVASAGGAAAASEVYSTVAVDDRTITITVPIDVVGGSEALIAAWREGIDRAWNHGNGGRPFTACGREVRFDAQFALRSSPPSRPAHLVIVEDIKPGQPYLSSVWHALGTSPTYSPRTGLWGSTIDGATAAHEFGHLLGLFDEYGENDTNNNGAREPGERPVPDTIRFPDAMSSLMATETGKVLQRHIHEVLRVHDVARELGCTF